MAPAARAVRFVMDFSLRFARGLLAERGLRRGEPRDRHAERRAGHVVEPDLMAERDRGGIAAVLAADADLELVARLAPALDAGAHQFSDAPAVRRHAPNAGEDSPGRVWYEEALRVRPAVIA